MIPPVYFFYPALPWLLGLRCAFAYWQALADTFGAASSADIVVLPARSPSPHRAPLDGGAELFYLTPKRR